MVNLPTDLVLKDFSTRSQGRLTVSKTIREELLGNQFGGVDSKAANLTCSQRQSHTVWRE